MRTLRFLYDTLREKSGVFWTICAVSLVDGIFVNLMALSISRISATDQAGNERVVYSAVTFLILSLLTSYFIRRYGETLALSTAEYTRTRMIAWLADVPLLTLQRHHSGYLLSLVNRVADTLQPVLYNLFWWGVRSIAFLVVILLLMLRQSVTILLIDMVVVGVFIVLSQWLSAKILVFNKDVNHAKSEFMSVFADFASNISTVRRLHLTQYMNTMVRHERAKVVSAVVHQQEFHAVRWLMLHAVFGLLFTLTFGALLWQLHTGMLEIGAFVTLVWFFFGLRGDLNNLAENLKVYTELGGYIEQIQGALAHDDTPVRPIISARSDLAVDLRHVIFSYPGSRTKITIPSLQIRRGQIVAITGPSGQGKSTILHLVAGLLSPDQGVITLGMDVSDIAVVSQEIELFNMSLRENITLGASIGDRRLHALMAELDLDRIVKTHPEGLDVMIGEKGLRLSTGQKQRVNLLRAFVQDRSIYLLDEPIAHLDPRTSDKTVAFVRRHLEGKTCIIISHQDRILEIVDAVYTMRRHILQKADI